MCFKESNLSRSVICKKFIIASKILFIVIEEAISVKIRQNKLIYYVIFFWLSCFYRFWQINLFKATKYILLGRQSIKHTYLLKQNKKNWGIQSYYYQTPQISSENILLLWEMRTINNIPSVSNLLSTLSIRARLFAFLLL